MKDDDVVWWTRLKISECWNEEEKNHVDNDDDGDDDDDDEDDDDEVTMVMRMGLSGWCWLREL